jgi:hypothetical protein
MKRVLFALVIVLSATEAFAVPCIKESWSNYLLLTDCTIGTNTLSQFTYTDPNSVLNANNILTSPGGIGLVFDLTGFNGTNKSVTLGFRITGTEPFIAEERSMVASITGSGSASVNFAREGGLFLDVATSRTMTEILFSPARPIVDVSDTLALESGVAMAGTAEITRFSEQFVVVPEPASILLVGSGLCAMALGLHFFGIRRLPKATLS